MTGKTKDILKDIIEKNISKNNTKEEIDKDSFFNQNFLRKIYLTEEEEQDLIYKIKYINTKDKEKLERYLMSLSMYEFKKAYIFKLNNERTIFTVFYENLKVEIPIEQLVKEAGTKLKIFFKFKDEKDF